MKVTEVDRRTPETRRRDDRQDADEVVTRLGRAERQLRAQMKRNQVAWDQGFACAIDMFARESTASAGGPGIGARYAGSRRGRHDPYRVD